MWEDDDGCIESFGRVPGVSLHPVAPRWGPPHASGAGGTEAGGEPAAAKGCAHGFALAQVPPLPLTLRARASPAPPHPALALAQVKDTHAPHQTPHGSGFAPS